MSSSSVICRRSICLMCGWLLSRVYGLIINSIGVLSLACDCEMIICAVLMLGIFALSRLGCYESVSGGSCFGTICVKLSALSSLL